MADISFQEMAAGIGEATGDALVDLANTAADFFCDVYAQFPAAIVSSPLDNPGARLVDGLARRVCAPRDKLPDDPTTPFTGGQCECAVYRITYTTYVDGASVGTNSTLQPGPLSGPSLESDGSGKAYGLYVGTAACGGRRRYNFASGFAEFKQEVGGVFVTIDSVVPDVGQPNTCGDPAPQYDQRVPTLDDIKQRIPIPVGGTPVDVDIEINPVQFNPGINFKPQFNINVGGIQVNIEMTGAKINIGPQFNLPPVLPPGYDPRNPKPSPDTPPGSPELGDIADDLSDILDKLDELKECACGESGPILSSNLGVSNGDALPLPSNCFRVFIQLSTLSPKPKVEFGNNDAPNVYYAGWYSFGSAAHWGERLPLTYEYNYLDVPEWATTLSFTCRAGYEATLTAFYYDVD